jgi:hypothetical protein
LAGKLRLEWIMDWKKVGVRSLTGELRLEFIMENPRLAGGFNTERIAFGVPKRVRCFESIDREVET